MLVNSFSWANGRGRGHGHGRDQSGYTSYDKSTYMNCGHISGSPEGHVWGKITNNREFNLEIVIWDKIMLQNSLFNKPEAMLWKDR